MTEIGRSGVLTALSRLLKLSGTKTIPAEVDISAPIQTVFDVGPMSSFGGGLFVTHETQLIAALGSSAYGTLNKENVYTTFANTLDRTRNLGLTPGNSDVWWLGTTCFVLSSEAGNFDESLLSIYPPNQPNYAGITTERYAQLAGYWDGVISMLTEAGGSWQPCTTIYNQANPGVPNYQPRPINVGELRTRADATAGGPCTVSFRHVLFIVPRGVRPPGL